jgi:hypothetical protein
MKTKYHKYSLKGDHSAADAHRALGEGAAQGTIVRIDSTGGDTHVYLASEEAGGAKPAAGDEKKPASGGIKGQEVTENDVLKLG